MLSDKHNSRMADLIFSLINIASFQGVPFSSTAAATVLASCVSS